MALTVVTVQIHMGEDARNRKCKESFAHLQVLENARYGRSRV